MKKLIEAWEKSKKNTQFQAELEQNRKKNIEMILSLRTKINEVGTFYTRKELEDILNEILAIDRTTINEDIGWITEISCSKVTKDELFIQFISTIATWYMYLGHYERKEDYELCAKILDVLAIERQEFIDILMAKYGEINEIDIEYIDLIFEEYQKEMMK